MSLSLLSLQATVICDGKAMDTYSVQQDGASALSAYVASEAGKVGIFSSTGLTEQMIWD